MKKNNNIIPVYSYIGTKQLGYPDIIKIVSDNFNITSEAILQKTHRSEIVYPRQLAVFFCLKFYRAKSPGLKGYSFLAKNYFHFDRVTIMHSEKVINDFLSINDRCVSEDVEKLSRIINEKSLTIENINI